MSRIPSILKLNDLGMSPSILKLNPKLEKIQEHQILSCPSNPGESAQVGFWSFYQTVAFHKEFGFLVQLNQGAFFPFQNLLYIHHCSQVLG